MELFLPDGCLSDEGLNALASGSLDELERLEAAEHLSYCDHCMDRYTALLTEDILEPPPRSVRSTVMTTIWVRVMQNTYGRAAVAAAAAVLALTFWRTGASRCLSAPLPDVRTLLPQTSASQTIFQPSAPPELLGKPADLTPKKSLPQKVTSALESLFSGSSRSTPNPSNHSEK